MLRRGEGLKRTALSLSSSLLLLANKIFCRSFSVTELTFFLSSNSTKMCFQPSSGPCARLCSSLSRQSCTAPGRLGLTSARKADHLLGFSVCSWEGGLAEQITKQAPVPAPDGVGRGPRGVGKALPAAGLRWTRSSRYPRAREHRNPKCPWANNDSKARCRGGPEGGSSWLEEGLRCKSSLWTPHRLFCISQTQFSLTVKWEQM